MNIRTSTMLIGIRGTCGWVENRDGLSRVYLLEGKVECSAGNQTVWVNAGEMAELTSNRKITVTAFTEQDVPAFVRDDLDPDLIDGMGEVPGPDDPDTPEPTDLPETTDIPETADGEGELYYEPDNADDLLAALRSAPSGATITLANSFEVEKEVIIPNGTADNPVILDLNGYTLNVTGRYSFEVSGALLIRDTSSQGSGKLAGVAIIVSNSAYLNLVNGTITAGTSNAVYISKNASFIMNGGTIENDDDGSDPVVEIYGDKASFTMNGGTIDGKYDAAVFLDRGTFTMKGGNLTSHHIGTSATVVVIQGGTLELLGGTITNSYDGTYSIEWYGAALHVQSPDTDIISFESTVIRSKKGIFIGYLADGSTWINWWPEGYTSTAAPDADGYYYMTGE